MKNLLLLLILFVLTFSRTLTPFYTEILFYFRMLFWHSIHHYFNVRSFRDACFCLLVYSSSLHLMLTFSISLPFPHAGLLSLWTTNWCECDTEMCQHTNRTTYNGNDFFCSSLFTQKRSSNSITHNQHKNKHSTNIASIGMCFLSVYIYLFVLCIYFLLPLTFLHSFHKVPEREFMCVIVYMFVYLSLLILFVFFSCSSLSIHKKKHIYIDRCVFIFFFFESFCFFSLRF